MPKIAPSNPLLLKGAADLYYHKHKIAKNFYFTLLKATDTKGLKGRNLRKNLSNSNFFIMPCSDFHKD
jgi:hypothetical protein